MGDTENTAAAGDATEQHTEGFKAPSSQEELDQIINKAVARTHKKYEDYDTLKAQAGQVEALQSQVSELETAKTDLTGKVETFQREKDHAALVSSVAAEKGVPVDALRGDTKEALESHADQLVALLKPSAPVIPRQDAHPSKVESSDEKKAVKQLFGTD